MAEHLQRGMARRWERHYPETRSTIASGMMLFGVLIGVSLGLIWPQKLSAEIFNSRLAYHLILDLEDYWTCDKDYINFIVDEPSVDTAMFQFWLFNISNAENIIDRGYKPNVLEVGPYGFRKRTYKYDVYIDPVDSLYVTYQEYTLLEEITDDPDACRRQYARMDRHFLASTDYCLSGKCQCRSTNDTLTIVNPLFLKTIHDDSTHDMIGQFSSTVFIKIKSLLEIDFVRAVQSHLVPNALREVYLFREQMQLGTVLKQMVTTIMSTDPTKTATFPSNPQQVKLPWTAPYTFRDVAAMFSSNSTTFLPTSCGLSNYCYKVAGFAQICMDSWGCPINGYGEYIGAFKALLSKPAFKGYTLKSTDFPDLGPLFDASVPYSLVNTTTGFPNWLGLAWQMGLISYNFPSGYTLIKNGDMTPFHDSVVDGLCTLSGMASGKRDVCYTTGSALVLSVLNWLAPFYDVSDSDGIGIPMKKVMAQMVYTEFLTSSDLVQCAPLGRTCVWQWGYMKTLGSKFPISPELVNLLIDYQAQVDTNPTHIYFSRNAASYFNAHKYCTAVLGKNVDLSCDDLGFCVEDGLHNLPAAFSGVDDSPLHDTSIIKDRAGSVALFKKKSHAAQMNYVWAACNMSSLIHSVYPTKTDFHEDYVIAYLNNPQYRDPSFTHKFSKTNWEEVGWAQFGCGVITDLITSVRAIYQVTRNAMWHFGPMDYFVNLIEFSSWSITTGYPASFIYNVDDARALLYALADTTTDGVAFRRNLVYTGTTLIGDGIHFTNEVGAIGDFAFTPEANRGVFNCTGKFAQACDVLSVFYTSSPTMCQSIDNIYQKCRLQVFSNNYWVTNCGRFQIPNGIQCNNFVIYGKPHPYKKSRGNVVYEMMHALANVLRLKTGLLCKSSDSCRYDWGGFVTTTRVRSVLFEGYTEPTVLEYLNLKHLNDNISMKCNQPVILDRCVVPGSDTDYAGRLRCDHSGLIVGLPNGQSKILLFGSTPNDEYFAPYFEVVAATGEMLWAYSMDPSKVRHAAAIKLSGTQVVRVQNPNWAAYPAWNTPDVAFNKFYQCQKRYYGGMPFKFNSCTNRLNTGRIDISKTMDLEQFQGNSSIYWFDTPADVNGSFNQNQAPMSLWDGFLGYPYIYNSTKNGTKHREMQRPRIFHKTHPLNLVLDATQFIYEWEFNVDVAIPVCTEYDPCVGDRNLVLRLRRFEESTHTWQPLRTLGTPLDSYGMPYKIPLAMSSLERLAGFQLFAGTPHAYGNKLWGGHEFDHVSGYVPNQVNHRTFIDYDPITGKIHRNVVRQAVNVRYEANPIYPNVFGSQGRCMAPTKSFSYYTGYGCFSYAPLLWYEDGRVVQTEEFFRTYDHFYRRPDRAMILQTIGTAVGVVFAIVGLTIFLYEAYYRRKYQVRLFHLFLL